METYFIESASPQDASLESALTRSAGLDAALRTTLQEEDGTTTKLLFATRLSYGADRVFSKVTDLMTAEEPNPRIHCTRTGLWRARDIYREEGSRMALDRFRMLLRHSVDGACNPQTPFDPDILSEMEEAIAGMKDVECMQIAVCDVVYYLQSQIVLGIRQALKARGLGYLMEE